MRIPALKASNVQELRKLVKQVPTELRDLARMERRHFMKMDAKYPDSSAYAIARGGAYNNSRLAQVVDELRQKNAAEYYNKQPFTISTERKMPNVVKASSYLD